MKSTVYELMRLSESSEEEGFDEEDLVAEPEEEEEKEKEVKILVKDPDVELDIAEDEEIAMTEADDDVVTIEE